MQIVIPLSKAVVGTIAIWNLLYIWNDYLLPLLILFLFTMRMFMKGLTSGALKM